MAVTKAIKAQRKKFREREDRASKPKRLIFGARIEYIDQHSLWISARDADHAKKQLIAHVRRMTYPVRRVELFRPMREEEAKTVVATMKQRTFKLHNHNPKPCPTRLELKRIGHEKYRIRRCTLAGGHNGKHEYGAVTLIKKGN